MSNKLAQRERRPCPSGLKLYKGGKRRKKGRVQFAFNIQKPVDKRNYLNENILNVGTQIIPNKYLYHRIEWYINRL